MKLKIFLADLGIQQIPLTLVKVINYEIVVDTFPYHDNETPRVSSFIIDTASKEIEFLLESKK